MEPGSATVVALKLIGMGFCLGIGFYMSKKLTNKVDQFLFENSNEFKELLKERNGNRTEGQPQLG